MSRTTHRYIEVGAKGVLQCVVRPALRAGQSHGFQPWLVTDWHKHIRDQKEHHRKKTFREDLRPLRGIAPGYSLSALQGANWSLTTESNQPRLKFVALACSAERGAPRIGRPLAADLGIPT